MGSIQGQLKLWERQIQCKRVGEEAEGRGAAVGDSRREQPGSGVLQEQEAGKCQRGFRQL